MIKKEEEGKGRMFCILNEEERLALENERGINPIFLGVVYFRGEIVSGLMELIQGKRGGKKSYVSSEQYHRRPSRKAFLFVEVYQPAREREKITVRFRRGRPVEPRSKGNSQP